MTNRLLLGSAILILLSQVLALLSFFHFTPWTFLGELTLGSALGGAGFLIVLWIGFEKFMQRR